MVFSNNLLMGAAAAAASGDSVYVPKGAIWTNGTDEYLTRTPSSTGTPKVQTFSFWAKINEFGSGAGGSTIAAWADASNHSYIDFNGVCAFQCLNFLIGRIGRLTEYNFFYISNQFS